MRLGRKRKQHRCSRIAVGSGNERSPPPDGNDRAESYPRSRFHRRGGGRLPAFVPVQRRCDASVRSARGMAMPDVCCERSASEMQANGLMRGITARNHIEDHGDTGRYRARSGHRLPAGASHRFVPARREDVIRKSHKIDYGTDIDMRHGFPGLCALPSSRPTACSMTAIYLAPTYKPTRHSPGGHANAKSIRASLAPGRHRRCHCPPATDIAWPTPDQVDVAPV